MLKLPRTKFVFRDKFIVKSCTKKKVFHIGCSDAPFTEYKYNNDLLLHTKIEKLADQLAGLDIDSNSIDWLKDKGVKNVWLGDSNEIKEILQNIGFEPDTFIAGEVLEHLSEPYQFLQTMNQIMSKDSNLIISIPNAFSFVNVLPVFFYREYVHPEHVAYYSFYTIKEFLGRAGFSIEKIYPYMNSERTFIQKLFRSIFIYPLLFLWPHFSLGYVLIAKPKQNK